MIYNKNIGAFSEKNQSVGRKIFYERSRHMAKVMLRKTDRNCALCRYWNSSRGSDTLQPKMNGNFQVEATEEQTFWQRTSKTKACFRCQKFESRF